MGHSVHGETQKKGGVEASFYTISPEEGNKSAYLPSHRLGPLNKRDGERGNEYGKVLSPRGEGGNVINLVFIWRESRDGSCPCFGPDEK